MGISKNSGIRRRKETKLEAKAAKAKAKLGDSTSSDKPRVWVLDFKGSMDAHEVSALREEVTAVLAVVKPQDQVVVRLESPGGVVHGYGWLRPSYNVCAISRSR